MEGLFITLVLQKQHTRLFLSVLSVKYSCLVIFTFLHTDIFPEQLTTDNILEH
jgi:hypothetical protein